ncbi:MAG: SpoIVB peptidase S55 domain-containing protein [Vicinamibacterales bacterium]
MARLKTLIALVFCGAAVLGVRGQESFMPVTEIRPGMVGIGRTVFEGTRVEEFRAHVIGVLENVMGPQRNLILARLEGGPLSETGVIAGMSGSPVYVDGRLIGAVAYSLGSFSKEPLAGITPIDEMTNLASLETARPASARLSVELPITPASVAAAFRKALGGQRPFADRAGDVRLLGGGGVSDFGGSELGLAMRPIATPLVMSGFEFDVADALAGAFRDHGFIPVGSAAGTRPGEMPFDGPLKPGDAVGVSFVNGDLVLGGTGTVTYIDGDRVYAFGHPMYNLGPTAFPMTRAYVYGVLPSLFTSIKLTGTGETIGTLLQDRATAISGRLGPAPSMIPVTLKLEQDRGPSRTFTFNVVRDQMFTSLMTYAALLNTLSSYERQYGAATYEVTGEARLAGHEPIRFNDIFAGESMSVGAASYAVGPLIAVLANVDEHVTIDGLDLTFRSSEDPRTATLERVWIDDPRPRAGRSVPVKMLLRTYRGEDLLRTVDVTIPPYASGRLSLLVSDGDQLEQLEQREVRASQQNRRVAQIVRSFNTARRGNTLYVKLMNGDAGAVVNGERLPSLPPSVLAVHEAGRGGADSGPLSSATLGEWAVVTSHAVSGTRALTVTVSPN